MKVYVTRWALSRGILHVEAFGSPGTNCVFYGDRWLYKGDWHGTLVEAMMDFERRKAKKMDRLENQIRKLRGMQPKVRVE